MCRLPGLALGMIMLLISNTASAESGQPARELDIPFSGNPGPLKAITDVAGVTVGQATLISILQINQATKLIQEGVVDTLDEVELAILNSSASPIGTIGIGRSISRLDLIDGLEMLADRHEKPLFRPTRRVLAGGHKFCRDSAVAGLPGFAEPAGRFI